MTLDRTKKYKVGRLEFKYDSESDRWESKDEEKRYLHSVVEDLLESLNPVEVEEPLKWSFEAPTAAYKTLSAIITATAPDAIFEGTWRHEVVSTRIG